MEPVAGHPVPVAVAVSVAVPMPVAVAMPVVRVVSVPAVMATVVAVRKAWIIACSAALGRDPSPDTPYHRFAGSRLHPA